MPTDTHCPYCALQCGMRLSGTPGAVSLEGNEAFPVNKGVLCVKGWTAAELLHHPDRLLAPLARDTHGDLVPVTWEVALGRTVSAFHKVRAEYGRDAVGVFGGGSLTNEKTYLLGKFARVALGTSNIDYNGRFCMSSAAAASVRAFGIDRGLPFPVEDIAGAEVVLSVGGNMAETMPPLMQYLEKQRTSGGRLIVVDPRRSLTGQAASLHLRITPGTDAALANGILHVLVRDGLVNQDYIRERTEGWDAVRGVAATYWPERVERATGIPEAQIVQAARMLGTAKSAVVLTGRGPEQQSQGVNNVLGFINVALALGLPGKRLSGFGTITGQGNGQGGREHGQKSDQLPGYRRIDDPAARAHICQVWGISEQELPGVGKSAYEMLEALGQPGGVRALWVIGSNVAVSAPNASHVQKRLDGLDFLAVSDYFLSETAMMADVVFPSAQWAEEEGTMTNLEGRVIRRRKAIDPPTGVRTDIETLCNLASGLGRGAFFHFDNPRQVFEELRKASAGGPADYSGITYERIEADQGVFWPCPSEAHPGTPRMFLDRFSTPSGKARFHAVRHQPAGEEPDAEYPHYLTTGRVLAQYQSGVQTRRVRRLQELAPQPLAEMHPSLARRYGLADGDSVTLATRRGRATFRVKATSDIREDTIFVPFHWPGDASANLLTNPALDPVSRMPEFKVCAVRIDGPRSGRAG